MLGSRSYMCANFWSFFHLNVGDGALGSNLVPIAKELCKKLTYPLFDYYWAIITFKKFDQWHLKIITL